MKLALIAMSGKPFHNGHFNLIKTAAVENDKVVCYVSSFDRVAPNQIPVFAHTMKVIWDNDISKILPENVVYSFEERPIGALWVTAGKYNRGTQRKDPKYQFESIKLYTDEFDHIKRFSVTNLKKYVGHIYAKNKLSVRPVARGETDNISGTLMRQYLGDDNFNDFCRGLPYPWHGDLETQKKVWEMLREDIADCNIVCIPKLYHSIKRKMTELSLMMPKCNVWSEVKYHLIRTLYPDDRLLLTRVHPVTKFEHPDACEIEMMKLWVELTKTSLKYSYDGEERLIEYVA